jgi:hypothetical protein
MKKKPKTKWKRVSICMTDNQWAFLCRKAGNKAIGVSQLLRGLVDIVMGGEEGGSK